MVCGFLVVIALAVAAFYAYKTRGKIWRYGKPNIYWDPPLAGGLAPEGRNVEEWVRDRWTLHTNSIRLDLQRIYNEKQNLIYLLI